MSLLIQHKYAASEIRHAAMRFIRQSTRSGYRSSVAGPYGITDYFVMMPPIELLRLLPVIKNVVVVGKMFRRPDSFQNYISLHS